MPFLGLGTWNSAPGQVADAVAHALRVGIRHIDAAHIYLNQRGVGEGLRRAFAAGLRREEVWITSKIWMTDFAPERVGPAVDTILTDLGLHYVDQMLLHWPVPLAAPPPGCPPQCPERWEKTEEPLRPRGADGHYVQDQTPLVDTWRALSAMAQKGKVRSIGVSNFMPHELEPLLREPIPPAVNQVECHPYWQQDDLRSWMQSRQIALVAYSPLGNPAVYERSALASEVTKAIATRLGRTPAQVLLRWSLQKGNIVIPKSVNALRIDENAAVFDFALSADDMAALNGLKQRRLSNPPLRESGRPAFDETAAAAAAEREETMLTKALAREWADRQAAAAAAAAAMLTVQFDLRRR
jgi:diketogulonate reductase-like aldo/keto reductase